MAVTRVLRLLRILADHPAGLALTPLCMVMNAPKTSVLSLLRGLTVHGYLQRSNEAYGLGPESFALGASLVSARSLDVVALPFLREAAERSGETALIARIDRAADRLVYNPIIESTRAIRYAVPVGTTRPLFASSAGRVLLAFQDEAWRRDYLRRADLRAMTEHSVTDPAQLARLIEAARVSGLAVTFGEVTLDVAGFSAPIFEPDGRVNAALIIAAPIDRGRAAAAPGDGTRRQYFACAGLPCRTGTACSSNESNPPNDSYPPFATARRHKKPHNNLTRRLTL
jgi:DNA-binding IclR family transcriptional regulator